MSTSVTVFQQPAPAVRFSQNVTRMASSVFFVVLFAVLAVLSQISGAHGANRVSVMAGDSLALNCSATSPDVVANSSRLYSDVIWLLNDVPVSNKSRLLLTELSHAHHGSNLSCVVGSTLILSAEIVVEHKKSEMAFEIGSVLTLNCTWLPTAATNVTWYHEDQVIPADMATLLDDSTSQLRVPDVTREEAGAYTCASSEGIIFHKYNVSIGLFPMVPDELECSGFTATDFTCRWTDIPETYLPTNVNFEYNDFYKRHSSFWKDCPSYQTNSCLFQSKGGSHKFRLRVTNPLGEITAVVKQYSPAFDLRMLPPQNISVIPYTSFGLDVSWDFHEAYAYIYDIYTLLEMTEVFTGNVMYLDAEGTYEERVYPLQYANSEYCVRMKSCMNYQIETDEDGYPLLEQDAFGDWSKQKCGFTVPEEPQVSIDLSNHYEEFERSSLHNTRDIKINWTVTERNNYPYQGISRFEIKVVTNDSSSENETLVMLLDEGFRTSLLEDEFSFAIPGLMRNNAYLVSLLAVNSAGSTESIYISIRPSTDIYYGVTVLAVIGVVVSLGSLFIMALLAFGFQRLKNNSKPLPMPVFHGAQLGNLKPNKKELEIFDDLPHLKEAQQQQSKTEDGRTRTPSGTSSGIGSDMSGDAIEKAPLLQTRTDSESSDKSHYVRLSTAGGTSSALHNHPWAPDAMEAEAEPLVSLMDARFSSMDEGISLGGSSSNYMQMGGNGESSLSLQGSSDEGVSVVDVRRQVADWHQVGAGEKSRGGKRNGKRDVNVNYIVCESSEDADDEWSIPSTPATPGMPYYSQMGPVASIEPNEQNRTSLDDTYVVQAMVPRSAPVRFANQNLASVPESPDGNAFFSVSNTGHSSPPTGRSVLPQDTGYVDSVHIDMISTTGTQNRPGGVVGRSSPQSSPEHAIIVHSNSKMDQKAHAQDNSNKTQTILDSSVLQGGGYVDNSSTFLNSTSQTALSSYLQHKQTPPPKPTCQRQDPFARREAAITRPVVKNPGKLLDSDEGYMSQESLSRIQVPAGGPRTTVSTIGASPGIVRHQSVPLHDGGYVRSDTVSQKQAPAVKNCYDNKRMLQGQMMKDDGHTSVEDAQLLPGSVMDSYIICDAGGGNKSEILVPTKTGEQTTLGGGRGVQDYVEQETVHQLQSVASSVPSSTCSSIVIQQTFSDSSRGPVGSTTTAGSWMHGGDGGYVYLDSLMLRPLPQEDASDVTKPSHQSQLESNRPVHPGVPLAAPPTATPLSKPVPSPTGSGYVGIPAVLAASLSDSH